MYHTRLYFYLFLLVHTICHMYCAECKQLTKLNWCHDPLYPLYW